LGVEHGVDTWVSCWDIWAMDEMGSNPLLMFPVMLAVLDGVAGLSGRSCCGGIGGSPPIWLGDTPPGNREEAVLGLAGTGNLGPPPPLQSGPGDGVGNVRHLSWLPGVWGVPGMALGVVSPGNMASALVGVCGVVGPPGYLGGPSPTQEDGVWGPPGVPGPLPQSLATGVLGS